MKLRPTVKVTEYSPKRKEYREGKKYKGDLIVWNEKEQRYDYY